MGLAPLAFALALWAAALFRSIRAFWSLSPDSDVGAMVKGMENAWW